MKKMICALMSLLLLGFSFFTVVAEKSAYDTYENFIIEETEDTVLIKGYIDENVTEIYVPQYINSLVVTVSDFAFENCEKLESITVGEENDYYKSIDGVLYSKDGKQLIVYPKGKIQGEVTITEGVEEIGAGTFKSTITLQKVNLPNSLKIIKNMAFYGCKNLEEIKIPDTVTCIGIDAFKDCEGLKGIQFPPYVYLQNNPFENTAFYLDKSNWSKDGLYLNKHLLAVEKDLAEFQIEPDTISIAGKVFQSTKIKKITIPASVKCVGNRAFALTEAYTEIIFEEGLQILGEAAFEWSKIKNITLPQSLLIIGKRSFAKASVSAIVIPDNVTVIDEGAFSDSWVKSVQIGKSVVSIGNNAFSGCSQLKEITIPDNVCDIGERALGITNLEKIHIGKNVRDLTPSAFWGIDHNDPLTIMVSEENPYIMAKDNIVFSKTGERMIFFSKGVRFTDYTIPDGVKVIGEYCFDNIYLKHLTVPRSVEIIEGYHSIGNLVSVNYLGTAEEWELIEIKDVNHYIEEATLICDGEATKNLYENLLYYEEDGVIHITGLLDRNIESITIPGQIDGKKVVINKYAFQSSKLVEVTLDEGIKEIPFNAFSYCKSLESINLENVEHIDNEAFAYCTSLKNINLLNIKSWDGIGEDRLNKETMKLRLEKNSPYTIGYDSSSYYTIFYDSKIENLRIKWPEVNFDKGAETLPAFFLNAEIGNVYFENFTISPSRAEFCGIDPSGRTKGVEPYVDITYPNNKMTIYGRGEDVKAYAESIGVPFKELIDVYLNGERIWMDDCLPYIKNDRTMVPMRAIFEALGAEVSWDDATKTAIGVKDGVEVKITIGENALYKNGAAIELDCAAEITNDRTMVPVRAISEAFGCTVNWNNETKTVEITY